MWSRRVLALFRPLATVPISPRQPTLLPADQPVEEERKVGYDAAHYYPTELGQIFNDTYQVATKIGYGGCSTVWLARDIRRWKWKRDSYVVLKICNNTHADKAAAEHELKLSQHIASANPSHPGWQYVRTVTGSFEIEGPSGTHVCLVYKPMREPMWLLQRRLPHGRFPSDLLKAILEFLLSALDYLHTECHVIHTDIKPENILIGLENPSLLDAVANDEAISPSPRKIVNGRTILLSRNDFDPPKSSPGRPKLADFDAAVHDKDSALFHHGIQPNPYRAPEGLLRAGWTYSTDIWNLGVMLWDLLENKPLFNGLDTDDAYSARAHLGQFVGLLGLPPKALLERGDSAKIHFNADGSFKSNNLIPQNTSLEDSITVLEGEDKRLFLDFARKMLQWLPEDRKTAKELLEDPWLNQLKFETSSLVYLISSL